jgi:hypothetical protein
VSELHIHLTKEQFHIAMTSLQNLTLAVTNLTTAVAAIPAGTPVSGDPGLTAAQANSLAATVNAQTAILTADVAPPAPGTIIPLAPASFTGVSAGAGVVNLSFTPSVGATSYLIEISLTTGGETTTGSGNITIPAPAGTVPPSPVTAQLTGLTVGTPVFVEVFAINAAGTSPSSLEITVTP